MTSLGLLRRAFSVPADVSPQCTFDDVGEGLAALVGDGHRGVPNVVRDADGAVGCLAGGWPTSLCHGLSVQTENPAEQEQRVLTACLPDALMYVQKVDGSRENEMATISNPAHIAGGTRRFELGARITVTIRLSNGHSRSFTGRLARHEGIYGRDGRVGVFMYLDGNLNTGVAAANWVTTRGVGVRTEFSLAGV